MDTTILSLLALGCIAFFSVVGIIELQNKNLKLKRLLAESETRTAKAEHKYKQLYGKPSDHMVKEGEETSDYVKRELQRIEERANAKNSVLRMELRAKDEKLKVYEDQLEREINDHNFTRQECFRLREDITQLRVDLDISDEPDESENEEPDFCVKEFDFSRCRYCRLRDVMLGPEMTCNNGYFKNVKFSYEET